MQPNSKMQRNTSNNSAFATIYRRTNGIQQRHWLKKPKKNKKKLDYPRIQGERSTMEPGDQTLQDENITIRNTAHNVNRCRTRSTTNNLTLISRNPTLPKSIDELNCVVLNADTLTNKMSELHLLTKTVRPHIIGINEVLPKNHNRKIPLEEFIRDGYEMIIHPNVNKNTGRGTLLYVLNTRRPYL